MTNDVPQQILTIVHTYGVNTRELQRLAELSEPLYYFFTSGRDAEQCWHALRAQVATSGYWPVILGNDDDFERVTDHLTERYTRNMAVATILADAATIDAEEWLRAALQMQDAEDGPWDTTEGEFALRGPWPTDMAPSTTISVPYDWQTHEPYPHIAIGLVPTTTSWQVPAYLRFGDYNACPNPAEHASIMKRWKEQYDTEVMSMTHDTIELHVAHPPTNRDRAITLAYEQFAYCSDIVDQGVETLDALAATLLNGKVWFFWWD
jgi:hypothetical protein